MDYSSLSCFRLFGLLTLLFAHIMDNIKDENLLQPRFYNGPYYEYFQAKQIKVFAYSDGERVFQQVF